jgi:hypothetical protein
MLNVLKPMNVTGAASSFQRNEDFGLPTSLLMPPRAVSDLGRQHLFICEKKEKTYPRVDSGVCDAFRPAHCCWRLQIDLHTACSVKRKDCGVSSNIQCL